MVKLEKLSQSYSQIVVKREKKEATLSDSPISRLSPLCWGLNRWKSCQTSWAGFIPWGWTTYWSLSGCGSSSLQSWQLKVSQEMIGHVVLLSEKKSQNSSVCYLSGFLPLHQQHAVKLRGYWQCYGRRIPRTRPIARWQGSGRLCWSAQPSERLAAQFINLNKKSTEKLPGKHKSIKWREAFLKPRSRLHEKRNWAALPTIAIVGRPNVGIYTL